MKRFISGLLAVVMLLALATPICSALSLPGDGWVPVSDGNTTADGSSGKMPNDAYQYIVDVISQQVVILNSQFGADSATRNEVEVMKALAKILIALNWICNNLIVYNGSTYYDLGTMPTYHDRGNNGDGKGDQIEPLRNSKELEHVLGIGESIGLIDAKLEELRSAQVPGVPTNFGTLFSSLESTSDGGKKFAGNDIFLQELQKMLSDYFEYKTLLSCYDTSVAPGALADLRSGVLAKLSDTTPTSMLTGHADKVKAFIAAYSEIIKDYSTFSSIKFAEWSGELVNVDTEYTYTAYYRPAINLLPSDNSAIAQLKDAYDHYSETSSTPVGTENKVLFNDSASNALELMSNAFLNSGSIVLKDGASEGELTELGYIILAAGLSYDPFVSKAGNDAYLAIIESHLGKDADKKEKLEEIMQVAINLKKPLYVTASGKGEWSSMEDLEAIPSEQYQHAFLAHVLQTSVVENRAYAMIKGKMTPSQIDSSSWEYAQTGSATTSSSASNEPTPLVQEGTPSNTGIKTVDGDLFMASSSQMTRPVMMTTFRTRELFTTAESGFVATVGGTTTAIIQNAAADAKDCNCITNAENEPLFVNGLGDIVLTDNTVILPAIANPLMYCYDNNFDNSSDSSLIEGLEDKEYDSLYGYYPYTATFMNHYPEIYVNASGILDATSTYIGDKYMLGAQHKDGKGNFMWSQLTDKGKQKCLTALNSVDIMSYSLHTGEEEDSPVALLRMASGDQSNWMRELSGSINRYNSDIGAENAVNTVGEVVPGLKAFGSAISAIVSLISSAGFNSFVSKWSISNPANSLPFFPLTDQDMLMRDEFVENSAALVTSAIRYISKKDDADSEPKTNGRFRVDMFVREVAGEAMLGTQYADTIKKNMQISYDELVADTGNRFLKFLVQLTDSAIASLGSIDGVLAIKGCYENKFFGILVNFIKDFYMVIAILLMVIVAVNFMKGHYNLIYVAFIGFVCVVGIQVYASWLPSVLPGFYNFAVNDSIEGIVWDTVTYTAELYQDTYGNANKKDAASGTPKPYTATMTLYALTETELEDVAKLLNEDVKTLRKGEPYYLDAEAGIWLQGNHIYMSVDSLFVNNSIRGLYQSQWDKLGADLTQTDVYIEPVTGAMVDNPYSIQLIAPVVSLESYYTPYDHIERSFMINLNTFANIFRLERNAYSYDNGKLYKDAFLYRSFINSGIFTAPGDDDILRLNIVTNSIAGDYLITSDELIQLCNAYFYPQEDWLNLRAILLSPDIGVQDTFWGRRLQRMGWYDNNWHITEEGGERLADLVYYVNTQTKQYVIKNREALLRCSDENAIKLTTLFATTAFAHFVSQPGHWVYPNYLNASTIELRDVLYGSMTSLEDKTAAYDGTVTNTVAKNLGIFGVLFILLIVVFSSVFVFIMTYLIPILYAMFGVMLIFKLINTEHAGGLFRGYGKVTIVSAALYFIFSLSLRLVKVGGYAWYGYLGCAIIEFLCLYFMFFVILSVVQDVNEMGNNTLAANLKGALDGLTRGALSKLAANRVSIYNRNTSIAQMPKAMGEYARRYNFDNIRDNGYYNYRTGHIRNNGRTVRGYNRVEGYSSDIYTDSAYDRMFDRMSKFTRDTQQFRRGWKVHKYMQKQGKK